MGFFDRHPVVKKAIANQYQAILAAGAVGFSLLFANPLPLLLFLGGNLMAFPFLFDRLNRRMAIEKKFAERKAVELTRDERQRSLSKAARARLQRLSDLCDTIQEHYRGLSPASQGILADQRAKFDNLLDAFLKRIWLVERYDDLASNTDPEVVRREIDQLVRARDEEHQAERVREALDKNLEIKRELLEALDKNEASRIALRAELDSLEALLQLLLQKSVAATDATAFSAEIDDVLAQAEADAASVEEMERMLGSSFAALPPLATPSAAGRAGDRAAAQAIEAGGARVRERLRN
jgi:predicted nucleic acid-binding protein